MSTPIPSPCILITRADEDADEVAKAIRARGGIPVFLPLHRVMSLDDALPSTGFDAVIATSARAFAAERPLPDSIRGLPVFCVGEKTAHAAHAAGCADLRIAGGSAEALGGLIGRSGFAGKSLLYLAGSPHRPTIEEWAEHTDTHLTVVQRYRVEPVSYGSDHLSAIMQPDLAAVLHFSPESARRFVDQMRGHGMLALAAKPLHGCFSLAVADALRTAFLPQLLDYDPVMASRPEIEALLDAVFSALASFSAPAHQSGD